MKDLGIPNTCLGVPKLCVG